MNWEKFYQLEENRYDRFVATLHECGLFLLNQDETFIGTYIFEDFDIDVRINLCKDNLNFLLENGWINQIIFQKCTQLYEKFCAVEKNFPEFWNINAVKTAPLWHEILSLSDEIKSMLYI
ncbi:MAG: hypothetical protein K2G25_02420 [Oscillospiraceae bacterium]|nr:hypothetical protein [Oscillospiraceae bacterium]